MLEKLQCPQRAFISQGNCKEVKLNTVNMIIIIHTRKNMLVFILSE